MINNMNPIEPINITELVLKDYIKNVKIFKSTKAIDIPDKINAIVDDFKDYNIEELHTKGKNYLNNSIKSLVEHTNNSIKTITGYVNDVIITNQNDFTKQISKDYDTFTNEMKNNIGNYLINQNGAYTISQSNQLIFSGDTNYNYDNEGRITYLKNGNIQQHDITYNEEDNIKAYKETITIDNIQYTKSFEVTYDENLNPIIKEI